MAPASAIIFAAATSRSIVLTPSPTISLSFSRICQTSSPLRRIFCNSAAVFRTIIPLQSSDYLSVNFIGRRFTGIHLLDSASRGTKILQYGARLALVSIQALPNHFLPVVVPNHQGLPIQIAQAVHLGWLRDDVIESAATGTLATAPKAG